MPVYVVQRNTDYKILGAFSDLEMAREYVSVQLPLQRRDMDQHKFCEVDTSVFPFNEVWNGYYIVGLDPIESFSVAQSVKRRHEKAVDAIQGETAFQQEMEGLI